MTPLARLLEAALFASPRPIPVEELAALDPDASPAAVSAALDEIRERYDVDGHGVELVELGAGWQILTRAEYTEAIERAQLAARPQRLSAAALESLAIVAYRQPIGRAEIEEIRGVSVGGVLKSLHERGLVDVVGRGEGLGRPLLYGTTSAFLEQFGLRHLEELPRADELAIALRNAGMLAGRQGIADPTPAAAATPVAPLAAAPVEPAPVEPTPEAVSPEPSAEPTTIAPQAAERSEPELESEPAGSESAAPDETDATGAADAVDAEPPEVTASAGAEEER